MSLSESEKLRIRVDALTWRLQEAADELNLLRREAYQVSRVSQDSKLAHLLGEEGPGDLDGVMERSEAVRVRLEASESLVERLQGRRAEAQASYSRALRKEWTHRIMERWKELSREEQPG